MSAALLHRASAASVAGLRSSTSAPRRTATATTAASTTTIAPRALAALALAAAASDRERRRRSVAARFFNFGKNNNSNDRSGPYGVSQGSRDDYCQDDVEHYFNYMGMLAVEGTYDRIEGLLAQGTAPVDALLLMAAAEGDLPKVEELLAAGADAGVRDEQGRSPRDLAGKPEVAAALEAATASVASK
jgi:hypothetical protein